MERVDCNELALQKVKISGDIIGKFGTFEIEQVFINNTNNVLEVGYTFPIVETATVVGFEVQVGDKVLKGKCKEKGKAKKEYQKNIVKGNSAYLMEQETDNIFKISIGKVDKNEEVIIKISYIDKFEITDNKIKVLMPTLVTPRYKSKITDKLKYGKVKYTVDFNIRISKNLNRKSIQCPSHTINLIDQEKNEIVEVLDYDLSRDFKLYIELKNELTSNALMSKGRNNEDMVYLSFMPEIPNDYEDSEKEYVFIVDVSGSMSGEKIDETKHAVIECLKQLDVGDKFNIIPFESEFEAMSIKALEYNEENLNKAIKYVQKLRPLGGTEILNPLKFALYEKDAEKVILLFTDGQVGNEDEIIKYVENNINKSRIFPFGIDTNVNAYFIKQMAKVGKGKAELILPKEKIDDKIIRTFARIQTPILENLTVNYGKNKVIDEIREDEALFNYEFFNVFAKIENLQDDIELKGKILDKEYSWKIKKEEMINTNVDLEVLFTKEEMDRLENYIRNTYDDDKIKNYKDMIIELSEKYNINSKYTSFITVYERNNKILDVPKYQETTLSNQFAKSGLLSKAWSLFGMDAEEYDYEEECDYEYEESDSFKFSSGWNMKMSSGGSSNDLDIPCFLRKKKSSNVGTGYNENKNIEPPKKTDREILEDIVNEHYKEFINQKNKSMLTFLLYALYYLKKDSVNYNYNALLRYLSNNKEELFENEEYMKLLYLCYQHLSNNRFLDKKETLELMNEDFRKIAFTNLKVDVSYKIITDDEMKDMIKNNKVIDHIDEVIWYLIEGRSSVSWLR